MLLLTRRLDKRTVEFSMKKIVKQESTPLFCLSQVNVLVGKR